MMFELFYNNPRTVLYKKRYVVCAWVMNQQIDKVIKYTKASVQLMWNTRTALWAMQQAMAQKKSKLSLWLPWWHSGKEPSCQAGHPGSIPGLGGLLGEGDGNPLQYLAWEIPWTEESDRLQSMGVTKSQTRLSD